MVLKKDLPREPEAGLTCRVSAVEPVRTGADGVGCLLAGDGRLINFYNNISVTFKIMKKT